MSPFATQEESVSSSSSSAVCEKISSAPLFVAAVEDPSVSGLGCTPQQPTATQQQPQLREGTGGTPQRRSILPMRYQSSDSHSDGFAKQQQQEQQEQHQDEMCTISPQSATLFPSYTSSSLSFRLPPQAPPLVPPKDMDGYTHSFYDLKATAVVGKNLTTSLNPRPPKPFWETLVRLLPWVPNEDENENSEQSRGKQQNEDPTNTTCEGSDISSVDEEQSQQDHQVDKAATLPKRPSSILRRSRFSSERMASTEQQQLQAPPSPATRTSTTPPSSTALLLLDTPDIPLLVSDSDSSISSSSSSQVLPTIAPPRPARRCVSVPTALSKRATSFDPRICIRQFNRSPEELNSTWFSPDELCNFRKEALQRILQTKSTGRAVFSHHALGVSSLSHDELMHDILIVDAHDICANLFAKGLQAIFPHARIRKARSTGEATQLLQRVNFDMMIIEERLKMFHRQESPSSGSCLLQASDTNQTLIVGVSAHLAQDAEKLQAAGADLLWTKPPPRMDDTLRKSLLKALAGKRSKRRSG